MTDAFAQIVTPVLRLGTDLHRRIESGEQPDLDSVKGELLEALADADSRASASRGLAADFALAKYAVVCWVDEILINSRWSHASAWREQILEWDFYRERLGGEKFYDRAEEAQRLSGTDPLETFYLCVALGFLGKYAYARPDLQRWTERAYARIASGLAPPEKFLPDDPRDADRGGLRPLPGKTALLVASALASATAIVTVTVLILTTHLAD